MIRGPMAHDLGGVGGETGVHPHRRIRPRLDYRRILAIGFLPHTVIYSEKVI